MKYSPDLQEIAKEHDRFILMAYKLLGTAPDKDKAKEMVQEMYIKLHERITNKDLPKLEYISAGYIFRMMRNQLYNNTAKKQYEYTQDSTFWEQSKTWEDDTNLTEWRQDISTKLEEIPYIEREVLLRHQEQSQRALYRETGVCRDRLRMYKNRALDKLKALYAAEN